MGIADIEALSSRGSPDSSADSQSHKRIESFAFQMSEAKSAWLVLPLMGLVGGAIAGALIEWFELTKNFVVYHPIVISSVISYLVARQLS